MAWELEVSKLPLYQKPYFCSRLSNWVSLNLCSNSWISFWCSCLSFSNACSFSRSNLSCSAWKLFILASKSFFAPSTSSDKAMILFEYSASSFLSRSATLSLKIKIRYTRNRTLQTCIHWTCPWHCTSGARTLLRFPPGFGSFASAQFLYQEKVKGLKFSVFFFF